MARTWFVQPDVTRLPLSDGEWIEIKTELNTGETQQMFANMRNSEGAIDGSKIGIARVQAYLLEWSLVQHGKPVPVTVDAIRSLHTDAFKDIRVAIEDHEKKVDEANTAKKSQAGETPSLATSASAA